MEGSILVIRNDYKIDSGFQTELEINYQLHIVENTQFALDVIDDHYIDIFIFMSDEHIEISTEAFLNNLLNANRSIITPVVFVSKNSNEELQKRINLSCNWYFLLYPIDFEDLKFVLKQIENTLEFFEKSITLEKDGFEYEYRVKDISRIERSGNRKITVFGMHTLDDLATELEFTYRSSLEKFLVEFGVDKKIKQAHQSWLVNVSKIREVRPTTMELVLDDGTIVPSSRKFIGQFYKKKSRKKGMDDA